MIAYDPFDPSHYPDGDEFYEQAKQYLALRKQWLLDVISEPELDAYLVATILQEVTEALRTITKMDILTQELFDMLIETESLYRQLGMDGDWNSVLTLLVAHIADKFEGWSPNHEDIDDSLLKAMLNILYQRSGAIHLSTGNVSQARIKLEAAIDYGLDASAGDPRKISDWLKAQVFLLEANIGIYSLETVEEKCRTLMDLNDQQPEPSTYIRGLIFLVMALAHRQQEDWHNGFVYAQMVIGIGYAEDYYCLVMAAITQAIEYAARLKQKPLIESYVRLWEYFEQLRYQRDGLPNIEMTAHYHLTLAILHFSEQDYAASHENYRVAYRLFKFRKDSRNAIVAAHGQALTLAKMKEFKASNLLYRDVARQYRRSGIISREVQVMYARVRAWSDDGRHKVAYRGYRVVKLRLLDLPANEYRQNMLDMIERDLSTLRSRLSLSELPSS